MVQGKWYQGLEDNKFLAQVPASPQIRYLRNTM